MGLDQYLTIRKYVRAVDLSSAGLEPTAGEIENNLKINSILEMAGASSLALPVEQRNWTGLYVEMVGIQWRKAYAVSDFFEKKFGEMENLKHYGVRREWLEELLDASKKILDTVVWHDEEQLELKSIDAGVASMLLPAPPSEDYDNWYAYQLSLTKDGLDKILGASDLKDAEFQYHGWW